MSRSLVVVALLFTIACKSKPPPPTVTVDVTGTTVNGTRVSSLEIALRSEQKGPVDVIVSPDIEVGPGVEAARTIADAGYPQMNVRSGRTSSALRWWRGDPPNPLHVERDAVTNGFVLRFPQGKRMTVGDRAAVAEMIAAESEAQRALVLRVPNGTFREALELARWLTDQPELAGAAVAIEVGPPSRE